MTIEPGKVKSIFLHALENCAVGEWGAYLDQACGENAELRRRVIILLDAHQTADSLIDTPEPTATFGAGSSEPDQSGTVIGPYKLLQPIGEGGMGTVYMAEQTEPVRRTVALKLIKAGMDSRQVLARFGAERQALALMDHPNIAKVFDAGTTLQGRPYFVMELVKGIPITKFCDERQLTLRERLELAIPVCLAVQHAHQKGIIHRDLKPSNVLIALYDGKPVPKIIDFGVAKAAGPRLTDQTLYTEFGTVIGTLEYMSPEQAELNQLDIDTRSDIYSLGVLLYELLTGSTPLEHKRIKQSMFLEVLRLIREEESPRPSMRLSTTDELPSIAACRDVEPRKLSGLVRGDLDWIVMKALEKDRNRRYETANGLAADLRRYLDDEPVQACPPSGWYRFRKFARRHKTALRIAAATALVLVLAIGCVSWALLDQAARRGELFVRIAETEQIVSAALIETEQLRKQAGDAASATSQEADAALVIWRQAEASLDQADSALRTGTADDRLRQRVHDERQQIEQQRARAQRKAKLLRDLDDARISRSIWIENQFDYAGVATKYAAAFAAYGLEVKPGRTEELTRRIRAEEPAIRDALIVAIEDWSQDAVIARTALLANELKALAAAADDDPWRRQYRAAIAAAKNTDLRALSAQARRLSLPPTSLNLLASQLYGRGDRDEALTLLRWVRGRHLADFWIHFTLGGFLIRGEDKSPVILEQAMGCFRTALALRPATSAAHVNLGSLLCQANQLDEGIAEYKKAIELEPKIAVAYAKLGTILRANNQLDEAIALFRKAIDLDPKFALSHGSLGGVLMANNQFDEAIAEYRKAIELDPKLTAAHYELGGVLMANNQFDEAIAEYRKAIELNPKAAAYHFFLGPALRAKNQLDEAITEFRKGIDLDPKVDTSHNDLGNVFKARNQLDEAVAEYRKAIELNPKAAAAYLNLGSVLKAKNQLDEAVAVYRRVIDLQIDFYAEAQCNLAEILRAQGQLSESLDFYKRGHASGTQRADWRWPSAQWVINAERLVRLESKLVDVLAGKASAIDNGERLGLLEVCRLQRRHAAAARLYTDAFTADPKLAGDREAGHRYDAACFASLAAAGQGTDADKLDHQERRCLRQQALAWLRAELDVWSKHLGGGEPTKREVTRQTLQHWQRDADLAGVRDADALQKLSAEERESWRKLWADVAELLKKSADAK